MTRESNDIIISIITVCLNCVNTIERTIQSVIEQDYPNVEYIIVDGGSDDGTLDILRKYSEKITYLISEKDKGIYDAMNKGIGLATGELVAFINDGDWYTNNALENISEFYRDNPADIIYGDVIIHNHDGIEKKIYTNTSPADMLSGKAICHQSCFIRTSLMKQYKYSLEYGIAADYDFLVNAYADSMMFLHYMGFVVNYSNNGLSSFNVERSFREYYHIMINLRKRKPDILLEGLYDYFRNIFYKFFIEKEEKWDDDRLLSESAYAALKNYKRDIAVFGNGKNGKRARKLLRLAGIDCKIIIDNDKKNDETVTPEKIESLDNYQIIITPVKYADEIMQQLLDLGCSKEQFILFEDMVVEISKIYYAS